MSLSRTSQCKLSHINTFFKIWLIFLLLCWVALTIRLKFHANTVLHLLRGRENRPFDTDTDGNAGSEVSGAQKSSKPQVGVTSEEPFCDTNYMLNKEYHTQYANGKWVAEGEGASCTVADEDIQAAEPYQNRPHGAMPVRPGPHLQCVKPSSWNISTGSARESAGWQCETVERECTNNWLNNTLSEEVRIHEAMRWVWHPSRCRLRPWNRETMIGPGSRLFMVGDSITTDQADALKCVLPVSVQKQLIITRSDDLGFKLMNLTDEFEGREIARLLDPDSSPLELLERARAALNEFWHGVFNEGLTNNTAKDVLMFNTGAHWTAEPGQAEKLFRLVASAIKATFHGMVVFRTNVMGHNECHKFSSPLSDKDELTQKQLYNWADFGAYNEAVVRAFQIEGVPNFRVMDLSMFERRPDGHVMYGDCLHYCKPGIPDVWNKNFLYHVIHQSPSNSRQQGGLP